MMLEQISCCEGYVEFRLRGGPRTALASTFAVAVLDTDTTTKLGGGVPPVSLPVWAYSDDEGVVFTVSVDQQPRFTASMVFVCVVRMSDDLDASPLHVLWAPLGSPGLLSSDSELCIAGLADACARQPDARIVAMHFGRNAVLRVLREFGVAPSTHTRGSVACVELA